MELKRVLDDENIRLNANLGTTTIKQVLKDIKYFKKIAEQVRARFPDRKFVIEKILDQENTYRVLISGEESYIEYYPFNDEVIKRTKNKY